MKWAGLHKVKQNRVKIVDKGALRTFKVIKSHSN